MLGDLDTHHHNLKTAESRQQIVRSTSFNTNAPGKIHPDLRNDREKGKARQSEKENDFDEREYKPQRSARDNDLTLVHELEPGPRDFKPLEGDPTWEEIEPNSGIRLK